MTLILLTGGVELSRPHKTSFVKNVDKGERTKDTRALRREQIPQENPRLTCILYSIIYSIKRLVLKVRTVPGTEVLRERDTVHGRKVVFVSLHGRVSPCVQYCTVLVV